MDNANYKEVREVIEAEVIDKEKKENHFKGNPDRNRILIILIIIELQSLTQIKPL